MVKPLKIGVLISGGGTNLQAIIDRINERSLDATIVTVISNKADAYGLVRAKDAGIRTKALEPREFMNEQSFNYAIANELSLCRAELVVMAGYMKKLGPEVLNAFGDAVINLHPALLPSFPGEHGITDAFEYGVKVSGVTVHFADAEYDTGPIIAQQPVRIEEYDTLQSFEAKIHEAEYRLLSNVIQMIADGRVSVEGGRVRIK